jgi:hypothetical protein
VHLIQILLEWSSLMYWPSEVVAVVVETAVVVAVVQVHID